MLFPNPLRRFRLRAEQDPDVEDVLVSLRTNMRATKHQAIMRLYRILHRELQEADAKFFVRWGVFLDAHPKAEWGSVVWAFEPSRPRIDAVRALGRLLDRELFAEPHFGKPVDEEDIPCPDELGHQDPCVGERGVCVVGFRPLTPTLHPQKRHNPHDGGRINARGGGAAPRVGA